MRKSKYLIGAALALVMSLATSGIAQGATAQQLTVVGAPSTNLSPTGTPISLDVTVDTQFNPGPGAVPQTPSQSVLVFDPKMDLGNTGKLPQCNAASLANTNATQADAACGATAPGGNAQVGNGSARLCQSLGGCGVQTVNAEVRAYNGVPSGGAPAILLWVRIPVGPGVTSVLTGTLNGNTLTVQVPETAQTGLQLTQFKTTIPIKQTDPLASAASSSKKKKKKKKKKKGGAAAAIFYITAKCGGGPGTWSHSITTTYRGGAPTLSATTSQPCTGQPAKKKKKKKKKKKR
jgi:hypothetical protein